MTLSRRGDEESFDQTAACTAGGSFSLSKNLCRGESAQVGAGELEGAAARLEWDRMP